jgi:hypothetical protein
MLGRRRGRWALAPKIDLACPPSPPV